MSRRSAEDEQHRGANVRARQEPLVARYREAPEEALITDRARTTGRRLGRPFHGEVQPGSEDHEATWPFGIHRAVGGFHDAPNPGHLLCAALAACLDSTIRMIAQRLGVVLTALEVEVTAEVDVRGTLLVDRAVPVGFQSMQCTVRIRTAEGADPKRVETMLAAAEHSCVVLHTLRLGVPVGAVVAVEGDGTD